MAESDRNPKPSIPNAAPAGSPGASSLAKPPRDAVIFVPGIGGRWNDQSLETISRQIARSMDLADSETGARYETGTQLANLGGRTAKVCTISRRATDSAPPAPVLDVLDIDYRPTLKRWFDDKAVLMKCLLVFVAIVTAAGRFLRSKISAITRGKRIKSRGEQLQLAYASSILLLVSCYLFLLLMAAWSTYCLSRQGARLSQTAAVTGPVTPVSTNAVTALSAPANTNLLATSATNTATGWLSSLSTKGGTLLTTTSSALFYTSPFLFVLATLFGVAAPDRWRGMIESAASDYVCLLYYMNYGTRRNTIVGELNQFVEGFYEWAGGRHRDVHVFAYSFGGIVALDALFPAGAGPARRVQHLHTLVSIACPFDMLRMLWPEYFTERSSVAGSPKRWINLYSPNDVISSNFRNDDRDAEALETVQCVHGPSPSPPENVPYKEGPHGQDLSFIETLLLMGLRAHAMYWDEDSPAERNCFTYIVERMPSLGYSVGQP